LSGIFSIEDSEVYEGSFWIADFLDFPFLGDILISRSSLILLLQEQKRFRKKPFGMIKSLCIF